MQLELPETPQQIQQRTISHSPHYSDQYGPQRYDASSLPRSSQQRRDGSLSPHSASEADSLSPTGQGVHPDFLEDRLRRLNVCDQSSPGRFPLAGQRIAEYENALTPSVPKQALGFKVIKRTSSESAGVNLYDFPNGMRSRSTVL